VTAPEPAPTSPDAATPADNDHHHRHEGTKLWAGVTALSMVFGRGKAAHCVADLAQLAPSDRVVDVGCGPGTAVRVAAARCEWATGVDPDPITLRFGRWLDSMRRRHNVDIVQGRAEALPLRDASATVVWALSSYHHWSDPSAGLAEVHRVLAPGGRLFLVERLTKPGAKGHRAHGLTEDQADSLVGAVERAGFTDAHRETHVAGRRTLAVVSGWRSQA